LNAMIGGGKSAWSDEQLHTMERLRDGAMARHGWTRLSIC
jgi:hypothetical protein